MAEPIYMTEGGRIDTRRYFNAIIETIERAFEDRNIPIEKVTANRIMFAFSIVRETFFDHRQNIPLPHNTDPILYQSDNLRDIFGVYLKVCEYFDILPSLYAFERFTGITEDTTIAHLTAEQLELLKSRREWVRNKLGESTLGVTVLANNDSSVGLMYTAQNQIRQETIKQGLSMGELPKLGKGQ